MGKQRHLRKFILRIMKSGRQAVVERIRAWHFQIISNSLTRMATVNVKCNPTTHCNTVMRELSTLIFASILVPSVSRSLCVIPLASVFRNNLTMTFACSC